MCQVKLLVTTINNNSDRNVTDTRKRNNDGKTLPLRFTGMCVVSFFYIFILISRRPFALFSYAENCVQCSKCMQFVAPLRTCSD